MFFSIFGVNYPCQAKIFADTEKKLQNRKKLPDAIKTLNDPYRGFSGPFPAFGLRCYAPLRTKQK
jgi:hypothetical protein